MHFDHEFLKQWEGQRIDAKFTLERLTHADGARAAFDTQFRERAAAIQFFAGDADDIGARRQRWREAAGLSHPTLVEIFERGETSVGEARCAYMITERPDESLSEVLGDRALSPDEMRDMLAPLLEVLRYLHERGFSHGELKPANIMAFGDQLKVSAHSLTPGGDTRADCAALGQLVTTALRGALPAPFAEMVKKDTAAQMEACLRGETSSALSSRGKWWAVGAAAIAGVVAFWPAPTPTNAPEPVVEVKQAPVVPKPSPTSTAPPPEPAPAAVPKTTAASPPPETAPAKPVAVQNLDGITQVMPDIPQPARNTITGRVRINIRVQVDGAGNVTQAALDNTRSSPYFTSRVLTAARAWKFPSASAPSEWVLRFELKRVDTSVSVAKAR